MSKAVKNLSQPTPATPQKQAENSDQTRKITPQITPATTTPPKTAEAPEPQIPVDVQDAWDQILDLTDGVDHLLYAGACADLGLNINAIRALKVVQQHIVDQVDVVNGYFKAKEEEPHQADCANDVHCYHSRKSDPNIQRCCQCGEWLLPYPGYREKPLDNEKSAELGADNPI